MLFYFNILVVQFLASQRKFIKMKKNNIAIFSFIFLPVLGLSMNEIILMIAVEKGENTFLFFIALSNP